MCHKPKLVAISGNDEFLPDELNAFDAYFDQASNAGSFLTEARSAFMIVNSQEVAGHDGVPGWF